MRKVLVTGGSRGLGLAIVRRLICEGYAAIAVARRMSDELAATIDHAGRTRPGSIQFVPFDLGDVDEIPVFVRTLHKDAGAIYGLVNNAALGLDGALAVMPNAQIVRLIRVNTLSPILLTKYVVRHMMAEGGGRVVNVASIVGFTGYSGLSAYSATKASLIGFTRSLAREVGRCGVTVNAVAPGHIDTPMNRGGAERGWWSDEEELAGIALGRGGRVEDVAAAVCFFASEEAGWITGQTLNVNGGSYMH